MHVRIGIRVVEEIEIDDEDKSPFRSLAARALAAKRVDIIDEREAAAAAALDEELLLVVFDAECAAAERIEKN